MKQWHERSTAVILFALAFLMPFWFVPISTDAFTMGKQALLFFAGLALMAIWAARTLQIRRVVITAHASLLSLLVLTLSGLLSAILSRNIPTQLMGHVLTFLGTSMVAIFGASLAPKLRWHHLATPLLAGAGLLGVVSLWQQLPWKFSAFMNMAFGWAGITFANDASLTLAGNSALAAHTLVLVGAAGIVLAMRNAKQRWTHLVLAALSLVGGLISLWHYLASQGTQPTLLPFAYGWSIAIEGLKDVRIALVGVGPENFPAAFHAMRDVSMNITPYWTNVFALSSTEILQTMTTLGLFGLAAWILVWLTAAKTALRVVRQQPSLLVMVAGLVAGFFLLPFSPLTMALMAFTFIGITNELRELFPEKVKELLLVFTTIRLLPSNRHETGSQTLFATSMGIATFGVAALLLYLTGRVYAAEAMFYGSLRAAVKNDGARAHSRQQQAIRLNPFKALYRRTYAETNLLIATNIARQPAEQITDAQKQLAPQLIQEAVQSSRAAAGLEPYATENWVSLANIYAALLGSAEGADQWAIAATAQAIQTDPINPQLRLGLGRLYLQLKQPEQAARLFEQAIQLKPDWADAFYNYGVALEEQKQLALAEQAYTKALSLVQADTEDYKVVQQQIKAVQEKLAAEKTAAGHDKDQALASPQQPTVPSNQPQTQQPNGFQDLVDGQSPAPEESNNGEIVLPENVGF